MTPDQSQTQRGFRPARIGTIELANEDCARSVGLSNVDEADKVEEPEGQASSEQNAKFTMWDV
jgi:hypothetical protein